VTRSRDDARRDELVERYRGVTGPTDGVLRAVVELAARVCGAPAASVDLVSAIEEWQVVSTAETEPGTCPVEESLSAAVLTEPAPVVVTDARRDRRLADKPLVRGGRVRFFASAPLFAPEGGVIGRLAVHDGVARELDDQQVQVLSTLAGRVVDVLELRLQSRLLEQVRAELAEAREKTHRASEELTRFVERVSHDLRTPLTAIAANAEMLANEPAVVQSEDARWMVDGTRRAAGRMNEMLETMADFARLGGTLRIRTTDLALVVECVLTKLAGRITETGAEVTVGDMPVVRCDEDQMYVALTHLVSNALTSLRPDLTPRVELAATRRGERWRVSVTDNGVGVPPERRETMFVRFPRADPRADGNGVGLAGAKRVVEAHGGRIGVDDAPGGGATVWFELPA
jgi:signal transduction histidine kinase